MFQLTVMKKNLLGFFILHLSLITCAQTEKVSDNLSMKSKILNMDRKYAVYLPPDYETSQRSYPVLYLLHGTLSGYRWVAGALLCMHYITRNCFRQPAR